MPVEAHLVLQGLHMDEVRRQLLHKCLTMDVIHLGMDASGGTPCVPVPGQESRTRGGKTFKVHVSDVIHLGMDANGGTPQLPRTPHGQCEKAINVCTSNNECYLSS